MAPQRPAGLALVEETQKSGERARSWAELTWSQTSGTCSDSKDSREAAGGGEGGNEPWPSFGVICIDVICPCSTSRIPSPGDAHGSFITRGSAQMCGALPGPKVGEQSFLSLPHYLLYLAQDSHRLPRVCLLVHNLRPRRRV